MPDEDRDTTHLSAERMASYLDGNLTSAEHNAALAHFNDCADCRREMTGARRVIALSSPTLSKPARAQSGSRARRTLVAALAATLVFAIVPTLLRNRSHVESPTRGMDRSAQSEIVARLATVSPADDDAIAPASDSFVWRAASADAEYRLTITDATGGVVWRKSTTDTSVALPGDLRLQHGEEYFWSVNALLANGHSTTTRAHHFTIR